MTSRYLSEKDGVKRGDIFIADFTDSIIDFQCKKRPVVIVQNNTGNKHSDSYIAAVITSRRKKEMPTHIILDERFGLRKNSTVLCEHLVTVRRTMLQKYIGTVAGSPFEKKIDEALEISLELKQ